MLYNNRGILALLSKLGWEPFSSAHGLVGCNFGAGGNAWARTERTCHSGVFEFRDSYVLYMFYRYEHYLSISQIAVSDYATVITNHHHHHHVVLVAWISLTFSRHFSLSFFASGRSSGLHPVFSHSCWMYVRAGRPAFARPCVGVHKSTSLMSSSLLLQQCPACLVRLTWIVFVMGGRWPYSCCFMGCYLQDLKSWTSNYQYCDLTLIIPFDIRLYSVKQFPELSCL